MSYELCVIFVRIFLAYRSTKTTRRPVLVALFVFLNVVPYHAFAWVNIPTLPTATVPPPVPFESIKKYLKPQFAKKSPNHVLPRFLLRLFVLQELVVICLFVLSRSLSHVKTL